MALQDISDGATAHTQLPLGSLVVVSNNDTLELGVCTMRWRISNESIHIWVGGGGGDRTIEMNKEEDMRYSGLYFVKAPIAGVSLPLSAASNQVLLG
jgi:hypothetical protein